MRKITIVILFFSVQLAFSQDLHKFGKNTEQFFSQKTPLDSSYYFFDQVKVEFPFTQKFLGPADANFGLKYSRHFALRINSEEDIEKFKNLLPLYKHVDNNDSELTWIRVLIHSKKGDKINSKKIKNKHSKIIKKNGSYFLDLKTFDQSLSDKVVEIEFFIEKKNKNELIYVKNAEIPLMENILILEIPEIYHYERHMDMDLVNIKTYETRGPMVGIRKTTSSDFEKSYCNIFVEQITNKNPLSANEQLMIKYNLLTSR